MKVYTYSQARQSLALLLEEAWNSGGVQIRRRDGQRFVVRPEKSVSSPLDVAGVNLALTSHEIVSFVHEGRRTVGTNEQALT